MSSCLHVMSMSSHSACLVFPGPTGANHLDLQIFELGWERCWRCCLAFARLCQILHHFDCQPWGSQSMMSKLGVWFSKKNPTLKNPKLWRFNHCWIVRLILQSKKKYKSQIPSKIPGLFCEKNGCNKIAPIPSLGKGAFQNAPLLPLALSWPNNHGTWGSKSGHPIPCMALQGRGFCREPLVVEGYCIQWWLF